MFKPARTINQLSPAFSIIEIMAVLLIVSLGIIGVSHLAVQSMQAQTINRGSIIGYQLAQEGIEIVRQIRDTNWLQEKIWNAGLATGQYCVDFISPVLRPAGSANDCRLYLTGDNYYYSPITPKAIDTPSDFSRIIYIQAATSSASVKARVTWHERDRFFNYEVETEIYDWK